MHGRPTFHKCIDTVAAGAGCAGIGEKFNADRQSIRASSTPGY
jgi:phage shock protein PspC (stress-responsive transcriptional regulator)